MNCTLYRFSPRGSGWGFGPEPADSDEIDSDYGRALRAAVGEGVEVMAWQAQVDRHGVEITRRLPVRF